MSQGQNKERTSRLYRWLQGTFICSKCGNNFGIMSFGYGEAICPNCYNGEKQFIFFDKNYVLNRIIRGFRKT